MLTILLITVLIEIALFARGMQIGYWNTFATLRSERKRHARAQALVAAARKRKAKRTHNTYARGV